MAHMSYQSHQQLLCPEESGRIVSARRHLAELISGRGSELNASSGCYHHSGRRHVPHLSPEVRALDLDLSGREGLTRGCRSACVEIQDTVSHRHVKATFSNNGEETPGKGLVKKV